MFLNSRFFFLFNFIFLNQRLWQWPDQLENYSVKEVGLNP